MYESYAYWKLAIERITLDVIVVIVYFVFFRLKQRRKRDVLLSNKQW